MTFFFLVKKNTENQKQTENQNPENQNQKTRKPENQKKAKMLKMESLVKDQSALQELKVGPAYWSVPFSFYSNLGQKYSLPNW